MVRVLLLVAALAGLVLVNSGTGANAVVLLAISLIGIPLAWFLNYAATSMFIAIFCWLGGWFLASRVTGRRWLAEGAGALTAAAFLIGLPNYIGWQREARAAVILAAETGPAVIGAISERIGVLEVVTQGRDRLGCRELCARLLGSGRIGAFVETGLGPEGEDYGRATWTAEPWSRGCKMPEGRNMRPIHDLLYAHGFCLQRAKGGPDSPADLRIRLTDTGTEKTFALRQVRIETGTGAVLLQQSAFAYTRPHPVAMIEAWTFHEIGLKPSRHLLGETVRHGAPPPRFGWDEIAQALPALTAGLALPAFDPTVPEDVSEAALARVVAAGAPARDEASFAVARYLTLTPTDGWVAGRERYPAPPGSIPLAEALKALPQLWPLVLDHSLALALPRAEQGRGLPHGLGSMVRSALNATAPGDRIGPARSLPAGAPEETVLLEILLAEFLIGQGAEADFLMTKLIARAMDNRHLPFHRALAGAICRQAGKLRTVGPVWASWTIQSRQRWNTEADWDLIAAGGLLAGVTMEHLTAMADRMLRSAEKAEFVGAMTIRWARGTDWARAVCAGAPALP